MFGVIRGALYGGSPCMRLYLAGYSGVCLPRWMRSILAGSEWHRAWLAGYMGLYEEGDKRVGVCDREGYCYRKGKSVRGPHGLLQIAHAVLWRRPAAGITDRCAKGPNQPGYDMYDAPQTALDNWSGQTVNDLPLDSLQDYPELADSDRLRATVPAVFRGEVRGPALPVSETNSLECVRESFEVLAIDVAGNALTRTTFTNTYTGADGWRYAVIPKEDAFAQLVAFRGSAAEA
jgi:hypothetical protein